MKKEDTTIVVENRLDTSLEIGVQPKQTPCWNCEAKSKFYSDKMEEWLCESCYFDLDGEDQ